MVALRTGLLAALASLFITAGPASASDAPSLILVGLDGKTFFAPEGARNGPNRADALAFVDVSDEAHPHVLDTMPLDNSVYGPPTNLQITPDGRLGLLASAVTMRQEGEGKDAPYYAQPEDRLHVVDLTARPPRLVETITVGRQPSGLAINRSGDLALVANRESRNVTVLVIAEGRVRAVGHVDVGDEAAAIAFSPKGDRAFVTKNKAGKVGVLAIAGASVSYDPNLDMPVGAGVYAIEVTPDARLALTGNTGFPPSDGNVDTVSVIGASGDPPKVVDWIAIGDTPESLDVSPDGRHAAVAVVRGSAAPRHSPTHTPRGSVVLLAIDPDARVRVKGAAEAGAIPQSAIFSPSGRYVYVGNYNDRNLQVFEVRPDGLADTGYKLGLPGQPASMRGRARG